MTSQRLLSNRDRPLGNSILQSGASLGAIATPAVVLLLTSHAHESWRLPFRVIGAAGVFWVIAWLTTIRSKDLELSEDRISAGGFHGNSSGPETIAGATAVVARAERHLLVRRFAALAIVVITINLCWQYFRAWMPGMLREQYSYTKEQVQLFSMAYYGVTDVGCLSIGFLVTWLTTRGISVHGARMSMFLFCSCLTSLCVAAAFLPASSLLLVTLLLIGFGSLGQFPIYYALSQELSARRMGKVTGALSFLTWTATALVNVPIGAWIDQTHSYSEVTFLAGLMPLLGFVAILVLWGEPTKGG